MSVADFHKQSVEQLKGWLHECGAQLDVTSNQQGERRRTTAVLHLGVVGTVVQTPNAQKQLEPAVAQCWGVGLEYRMRGVADRALVGGRRSF